MKKTIAFLFTALAVCFCTPLHAQPGTVVITEILYDDTTLSDVEWVEIHNTTLGSIDISNWIIHDDNSYPPDAEGAWRIPAGTSIAPNQFLVLARQAIPEFDGEVICTQYFGSINLSNSGDNLALYTAETGGTLVDGTLTGSYPDQAINDSGNSIEKCNPNAPWSSLSSAWHVSLNPFASVGRYRNCTPGFANTPCPDTTPPDIDSVVVLTSTTLDVYFNETVTLASAEVETNYSINNSIGNPTLAVRDASLYRLVHLTTPTLPNNNYILSTSGIQDTAGNSTNRSESFTVFFGTTPGIVVISEIMYDDTSQSSEIEWVELHNRTGATVDISGWVLIDAANYPPGAAEGGWLVPASTTISANGYKVLGAVDLPGITGEAICSHYDITFDLNDAGDNLALYSGQTGGTLVDGAHSGVYPDLAPANSGYSIEKCHADSLWNTNPTAWHISANTFGAARYRRCTPGLANTPCTGDIDPPGISAITVVYNNMIDVHFDEIVDLNTSQVPSNYSVNNGVGSPTTAVRQADQRVVRLTFGVGITPNTYLLSVVNVEDQAANPVDVGTAGLFTIDAVPNIKFTEVMPDPNFAGAADSSGEWFEIHNQTASSVSMTGWRIADAAGSDTIEGAVNIAASQYFVFAARGDSAGNGGIPENYDYKFGASGWGLSLDNTGEWLRLFNHQGSLVCELDYTGQGFAVGRSAQLKELNLNPAIDSNWCQAYTIWPGSWNGDRGTPGAASICPDVTPPQLVSATPISNSQIDVLFNEYVGLPSAEVLANYSVNLGVGSPISAVRNNPNRAQVTLTFNPLSPNTYILNVNNVADTSGNVATGLSTTFNIAGTSSVLGLVIRTNPSAAVYDWAVGMIECPDSVSQVFFLKNFGSLPLSVTSPFQISGPQFTVTSSCVGTFNLNAGQMSSCSLTVAFRPQVNGAYFDTLQVISDASNSQGGSVRFPLSGSRTSSPQTPQVVVRRSGNNVVLTWHRIRQSTHGCPLTVDSYTVFSSTDVIGAYSQLTTTSDSSYTHINVVPSTLKQFYYVVATDN